MHQWCSQWDERCLSSADGHFHRATCKYWMNNMQLLCLNTAVTEHLRNNSWSREAQKPWIEKLKIGRAVNVDSRPWEILVCWYCYISSLFNIVRKPFTGRHMETDKQRQRSAAQPSKQASIIDSYTISWAIHPRRYQVWWNQPSAAQTKTLLKLWSPAPPPLLPPPPSSLISPLQHPHSQEPNT